MCRCTYIDAYVYKYVPVTEGKNIPARIVNDVVMSMMTWLYTFGVDVPFTIRVEGVTSFSSNVIDKIWSYIIFIVPKN